MLSAAGFIATGLRRKLTQPQAENRWIMPAPLSPEAQGIDFHGVALISVANGDPFGLSFTVDVICHLDVVPDDQ